MKCEYCGKEITLKQQLLADVPSGLKYDTERDGIRFANYCSLECCEKGTNTKVEKK